MRASASLAHRPSLMLRHDPILRAQRPSSPRSNCHINSAKVTGLERNWTLVLRRRRLIYQRGLGRDTCDPAPAFTCCPFRGSTFESIQPGTRGDRYTFAALSLRSSVDRASEYMYEQKPEFHRLTRARPQFGDAAATPVATRSEQASRARPGRSLLAPLTRAVDRATTVARGAVHTPRPDRYRRLSPRCLGCRARKTGRGWPHCASAGLCLTQSSYGDRDCRHRATRHLARRAARD